MFVHMSTKLESSVMDYEFSGSGIFKSRRQHKNKVLSIRDHIPAEFQQAAVKMQT